MNLPFWKFIFSGGQRRRGRGVRRRREPHRARQVQVHRPPATHRPLAHRLQTLQEEFLRGTHRHRRIESNSGEKEKNKLSYRGLFSAKLNSLIICVTSNKEM